MGLHKIAGGTSLTAEINFCLIFSPVVLCKNPSPVKTHNMGKSLPMQLMDMVLYKEKCGVNLGSQAPPRTTAMDP